MSLHPFGKSALSHTLRDQLSKYYVGDETEAKKVMLKQGTGDLKRLARDRKVKNQWRIYCAEKRVDAKLWLSRHKVAKAKTDLIVAERKMQHDQAVAAKVAAKEVRNELMVKRNENKYIVSFLVLVLNVHISHFADFIILKQ